MTHAPSATKRRLLGVGFLLVVVLFVAWSIASYSKTFKSVVMVDLVTDTVGNSLPANADVKARGMIVGEVRSATTEDGRVVSRLALEPDLVSMIPSNTTARLLPKTLFGERYVALQIPQDGAAATPIAEGAVIEQDTSGNAIEVGQLLDSLLPLLDAIPPQQLANTLGALSQALDGKGEKLGLTIDRLEEIFSGLNTELPTIQADLRGIADLSQTYSTAAPDLVDALDDLRVTGNTVVERQNDVETLLVSAAGSSGSLADLVQTNAESIVSVAADSRAALELLAEFSPSFGCTFVEFVRVADEAKKILSADSQWPGVRATINFPNPKGRYLPNQDEPRLFDTRGPSCFDDVTTPGKFFPQYPGSAVNDGSYQVPSRNPGPAIDPPLPNPLDSPIPASYAGSDIERDTLAVVYGSGSGLAPEQVPSWTTLVGAPALRGTEVSVR